jgi:hypothetical protein
MARASVGGAILLVVWDRTSDAIVLNFVKAFGVAGPQLAPVLFQAARVLVPIDLSARSTRILQIVNLTQAGHPLTSSAGPRPAAADCAFYKRLRGRAEQIVNAAKLSASGAVHHAVTIGDPARNSPLGRVSACRPRRARLAPPRSTARQSLGTASYKVAFALRPVRCCW